MTGSKHVGASVLIAGVLVSLAVVGCQLLDPGAGPSPAWSDNNGLIPPTPEGEAFVLHHDYPDSRPPASPEIWPRAAEWPLTPQNIDSFLLRLRKYAYDSLRPVDWRPQHIQTGPGGQGGWYHAPWQSEIFTTEQMGHGMPTWCGRDYYRGLYFGTPLPKDALPGLEKDYKNYEVVFYNDMGGWYLGRVWDEAGNPNLANSQMPVGLVIVKLVFSTVPARGVLEGAPQWSAFLPQSAACEDPAPTPVTLVQIDIAVKDPAHAPETGWMFTTYSYDKDHPSTDPWERMLPLGAMWGNDPTVAPPGALHETVVSAGKPKFFSRNLGWGGRLAGPIDAARNTGSCLGCHMSSEFTPDRTAKLENHMIAPTGTPTKELLEVYFRNLQGYEPFTTKGDWAALDYSFVLLGGLARHGAHTGAGIGPSALVERERF